MLGSMDGVSFEFWDIHGVDLHDRGADWFEKQLRM